jgi:alkylhydroperoxidase family enzyme
MERLPGLPADQIEVLAEVRLALNADFDHLPNSILTLAYRPPILLAILDLWRAVMGQGLVDPGLKWMVGNLASKSHGCMYCAAHTVGGASRSGVSDEKTAALWTFEQSPLFSEAERAALRFALLAAQVPNGVSDSDFATLRVHFEEAQCAELLAVVSLYGFFNRWNDTLATPLEAVAQAHAQSRLGEHGWHAGAHAR